MTAQRVPSGTRLAHIAGNVLISRLAFARARLGLDGFERVLGTLPDADQVIFRGRIFEAGHYPIALNHRLDAALAAALAPNDPKRIYVELGRASAENNLRGPHLTFLQPGDPQRFLANAKYIYKFYYAVGYRTYERTGPTSGVLKTFEAESVTAEDCMTVVGWHERALELCGASAVSIQEPLCRAGGAPHCEYRIRWSMTGSGTPGRDPAPRSTV